MSVKQIINDIKVIRAPYIYTEFYNSQECPKPLLYMILTAILGVHPHFIDQKFG